MTRTDEPDYEMLFNFRKELRRFLHGSEAAARAVGLTPAQHQLLLAIKGHAGNPPTIADVAEDLMLRHDSVSELIRRAADAGIVDRQIDREDHRLTRLHITASGQSLLRQLTRQHVDEIRRLAPVVDALRVG